MRVCALAVSVLVTAGCADAGPFECKVDGDCAAAAAGGMCEASGYCGFPDLECASGRRYGTHAPADIAGTCVPPEVAGDTSASDPTGLDDGELESEAEADTTITTTASPTTDAVDDSSSSASSLTLTTLDGSESVSSTDEGETSTTGSMPFVVEYVPVIAVCTENTLFDPAHCVLETGPDQITIDLSDSDGLVANIWVRFDLDDTLVGADVTSAEIVFVVGPDELDGSTNTGELWSTEPFGLADLSSGNPEALERIGDDLGAVRIGAEVSWSVPIDLVVAGESLHLALLPTSADGLDVYDANAATPPRLVVTAQ